MGAVLRAGLAEAHRSLVLKVYPQNFSGKMRKEVAVIGRLDGPGLHADPRILLVDELRGVLDLNVVMNKLDGEVLAALEDDLVTEEVLSAYADGTALARVSPDPDGGLRLHRSAWMWSSPTDQPCLHDESIRKQEREIHRAGRRSGLARRVAALCPRA